MDGNDVEKPVFHVAPKEGWVNDPNGPFMFKGKYHLFYQHLPQGCEWAFGLVWGHSVSTDLVHWTHLPHAIVPTPRSLDADGCFSGCAAVDTDGTPVLLYTGVRLRTNADAPPLPPPEQDLNLPFVEAQLYATPSNPDDPLLVQWVKEPAPFIGLPPPSMNLTGWRDPFVVERPCEANGWEWLVLMGSGIKDVGGATIVYRAKQLRDASSWRYDGLLCEGKGDTGAVWECPLLAELNPMPAGGAPLGSSMHDRLALGARRSYGQLSGSSSNALSSMAGSPPAVNAAAVCEQQQQQQQREKQQPLASGLDHHQQQHQQQQHKAQPPDKQQHSTAGDGDTPPHAPPGPSNNNNNNGGSNDSSSTTTTTVVCADGLSHTGSTATSTSAAAAAVPCGTNSTSSSSSSSSPGGGAATNSGPPYAVCAAGTSYPAFVSAATTPLSSWDERFTHFYSISPDACTNPTIYWLGRYVDGRFDIASAKGPLRLDLGDVLYAPNVMRDDSGRVILWGWLQERRTVGTYDYAGCMTVPRVLHLDHDRLHQSPAPELLALRTGETWQCGHVTLGPEATLSVPGVVGSSVLDIEAVFAQGSATTVGVLLRSWHQGGEGGAAVLFNWESGLLEVVFEALDPATMAFSLTAPLARRIGGPTSHKPGSPLALRLLLDGSCLEVFTGSGEALSTRCSRGAPPHDHADAGIEFVALDGEATLERVAAHEMAPIYGSSIQGHAAAAAAAAKPEEVAAAAAAAQVTLAEAAAAMAAVGGGAQELAAASDALQAAVTAATAAAAAAAQQQQQPTAAEVAAAAEALASLDMASLDLMAAGGNASDLLPAQAARLEKVLSVSNSLTTSSATAGPQASKDHQPGSITAAALLLQPGGTLSPQMSDKLQQLLLSPRAAAVTASLQQQQQQQGLMMPLFAVPDVGELPPEEEMTADIFGFE